MDAVQRARNVALFILGCAMVTISVRMWLGPPDGNGIERAIAIGVLYALAYVFFVPKRFQWLD